MSSNIKQIIYKCVLAIHLFLRIIVEFSECQIVSCKKHQTATQHEDEGLLGANLTLAAAIFFPQTHISKFNHEVNGTIKECAKHSYV